MAQSRGKPPFLSLKNLFARGGGLHFPDWLLSIVGVSR